MINSDTESEEFAIPKRTSDAQYKRIRRIFLSKPTEKGYHETERAQQMKPKKNGSRFAEYADKVCAEDIRGRKNINIDPYVQMLHSIAHSEFDEQKNQFIKLETSLERVIGELKLVQRKEERELENRLNDLKETFLLRVETLEQRFIQHVDEYRNELNEEIIVEKRKCELAIRAAATKLQHMMAKDQTYKRMDRTGPTDFFEEEPNKFTTPVTPVGKNRLDDFTNYPIEPKAIDPVLYAYHTKTKHRGGLSSLDKAREKLKRLEEKLATFSSTSVSRAEKTLRRENEYNHYKRMHMASPRGRNRDHYDSICRLSSRKIGDPEEDELLEMISPRRRTTLASGWIDDGTFNSRGNKIE